MSATPSDIGAPGAAEARLLPRDPAFAERARLEFSRQGFVALLGAELSAVSPGAVEIVLPIRPQLSRQHGYAHAGAAWAIADSAAGFAAQTLLGPSDGVLTVELKINLLAPAKGDRLIARGVVERAGRRLTVGRSDVYAETGGVETRVAIAFGAFMAMEGLADA
ncbi:PaaI family thioesterase [Rubrimonas cliftonensis]|uniref:Medium/long-chain acyl-CoA thioesterase YigI n=1 Tax=Rubrimonas cliftonensis TaxID=89524 RepID=A0A1H3VNK5_9RHOB|nr:PaaI family thioesterase [Rubrimonas cliftonensis]SDZ76329.1 uncharacterized domain 1-containing protein [Rubrimonas cliftonensis]